MEPKALVLTGYGINCDYETEFAFRLAGAITKRVHVNDLITGKENLENWNILALPGGFSFGDDIASGKVLANKLKYNLSDMLQKFIEKEGLVIGVCNGFQIMVKLGLLPGFNNNYKNQLTTLVFNDSGRFEDRWVYLKVNPSTKCIWTRGIEKLYLPVRHGEGKFIPLNDEVLKQLYANNQVAVQYTDAKGLLAGYPHNPNGSIDNIAGICDETGRIFGIMPHPEAHLHKTNNPKWTREKLPEDGDGLAVFKNAVKYVLER